MSELLVVRNLSRRFGGLSAVSKVSLAIAIGDGAGKSTLINMLSGDLPPSDGEILLAGQAIGGLTPEKISRLGVGRSYQKTNVFLPFTAFENCRLAALLSGGEQQMLTIGRALMTNPELLILDEATEGLAPLIAKEIWQIARKIRDTGIATVIVDKNHAAVTAIADRSLILVKGRFVFEGDGASLRARPDVLQQHLGV